MKLKERLGENDQSQIRMFDETPEDREGDTTKSINVNAKPEVFHSRERNIQKIDVKSPKFEDSASSSYSVEQTKGQLYQTQTAISPFKDKTKALPPKNADKPKKLKTNLGRYARDFISPSNISI